jgi:single-strand DNA-binding protein
MADGINNVTVGGNLTRDSELRGGGASPVLKFSIAANESYKDKVSGEWKERAEFVNCVIFGKRAEGLAGILKKGATVTVQGKLKTSSYEKNGEKRYSTDVNVEKIVVSGKGGGESAGGGQREAASPQPAPQQEEFVVEDDGSIPF